MDLETLEKRYDWLKKIKTSAEKLVDENRKLNEKNSKILVDADEGVKQILENISKTNSDNYSAFLLKRLKEMSEGTITLTQQDYFQLWTDMHIKDEIIFFNVTSRMSPKYWLAPEMQLYQKRQISNIKKFENYNDEEIESLNSEIRHKIPNYNMENNFERLFILDPTLKNDDESLNALVSTLETQAKGGIHVKVMCIKMNELSTFDRPQDFGIVLTRTGDLFGMYCDSDRYSSPLGGVIISNEKIINNYLDCYSKFRDSEFGEDVYEKYSKDEIKIIIQKLINDPIDISDEKIYGNRCYKCLLKAEEAAKNHPPCSEDSYLETWHKIIYSEQQAISDLLENRLKDNLNEVLEIGCGPGRIIRLIIDLMDNHKLHSNIRITGYEQNKDIANYCTDRFKNRNVNIYSHLVGLEADRVISIRENDRNSFDLILGISNLVGWQLNEKDWIIDIIKSGLKSNGKFFFTVYNRENELERARMYKDSGDIIELNCSDETEERDIVIVTDAFKGEKHISKAYTKNQLEEILETVQNEIQNGVEIIYEIIDIGKYMYGVLISKSK